MRGETDVSVNQTGPQRSVFESETVSPEKCLLQNQELLPVTDVLKDRLISWEQSCLAAYKDKSF